MWKRQVMGEGRMRKRREMSGSDVGVLVLAQEAGKAGTKAQGLKQPAKRLSLCGLRHSVTLKISDHPWQ